MENNLIAIEEFCTYYNVDFSFIETLHELGLAEIIPIDNSRFLRHQHLKELEKMIRLHYDLEINIEGIDVIAKLLKRIETLHQENIILKNRIE